MSQQLWTDAIGRVITRLDGTASSLGEQFPHWANTESGEWVATDDGDWTGGYYVGMHWLSLLAEKSSKREQRAHRLANKLRPRLAVDTVFKSYPVYYGCSVGAMLGHEGGLREMAMECARSLVEMYEPALQLIPLGSQAEEGSHIGGTETSIDSMQTAAFLYWASAQADDGRMREVAFQHADRISELHLREDGSFIQSSSLDPKTGALTRHFTHKGYSDTSTWGRAQAWGMLYSTMCYLLDPAQKHWLDRAIRGADWWLAHLPADSIAFWDFDDPGIPNTQRDTAATSIASAALLRLATAAPPEKAVRYRQAAESSVEAMVRSTLTPVGADDRRPVGMLTNACFNKRPDARPMDAGTNCEFIVGDYYFFESLLVLAGRLDPTKL